MKLPNVVARIRVLLAEDDTLNGLLTTRVLESLKCVCEVAFTGKQAVDMFSRFTYDLVLVSCELPDLDIREVVDRMREAESDQERTPILALRFPDTPAPSTTSEPNSIDDYLDKPVMLRALKEKIRNFGLATRLSIDVPN